jgi:DNA-binding transcriptional LysR family regulator
VPPNDFLSWKVVSTEPRWVALPAGHRLAARRTITLADLADEPFIALPTAAGPLRDFWLAIVERSTKPRIAAIAETAEETFEAVASGLGVALLSEGNATIYQRDDVTCRPVTGLSPSQLAVLWRTADTRTAVQVFVDTCQECLCVNETLATTAR